MIVPGAQALAEDRRALELQGHALDERVEGYTNLLWVLLLAALGALTPFELPLLALGLNLVTFGLTLWSLARAEARIRPAAWVETGEIL